VKVRPYYSLPNSRDITDNFLVEDTHDVDKEDLKRQLGMVVLLVTAVRE